MARLLADAIGYAEDGIPVTASQAHATASKLEELRHQPGFSETWLVAGEAPRPGSRFRQPALAGTLRMLASDGLDSFIAGRWPSVWRRVWPRWGCLSPSATCRPTAPASGAADAPAPAGTLWNLAPPTQGLVSLAILGITDRLNMADADDAQTVHRIVEATKRAFALRDAHITDPRHLDVDVQQLLTPEALQPLADSIDDASASPGAAAKARAIPSGWASWITADWQCRLFRVSITSSAAAWYSRTPGSSGKTAGRPSASTRSISWRWPLANSHSTPSTLPPRAWNDGRVMVYGSMGGDGQPQTQAALFTRYILQGVPLQESISRPRWLLGRTWGQSSDSLKLEGRFAPACIARLRELGHDVEVLADFSEAMGHAGAIVRHPNGLLEGATDPRSNGAAAGY